MKAYFMIHHLVQLHEMIVARFFLNHFSQMGKMVGWGFGSQRGAPLVETASVEAVSRSSVVKRIEMGGLV